MMQLTPVRCGNAECRIPLDEPPNLPFDQRLLCPKCGTVARCFEVGVTCHVTVTDEVTVEQVEVVQDPDELKKLQAALAYKLYLLHEISFLRFVQALPVEYRTLPYERTGVPDDDFKPLCTGIRRKDWKRG